MQGPTTAELDHARSTILAASSSSARELPWIGHPDPWAVFVSEVMLQQTQAPRVVGPWRDFLITFPTPGDCARAPLAQVLRQWNGLGFSRRAKFLHAAATMMVENFAGQVPVRAIELRTLPGVGSYTANAVASFAFGEPVAVLDTNVGRILARAIANHRLTSKEAQAMATALLGDAPSPVFNQTMIDLGAQWCRPRPLCDSCPIASSCRWHHEGGEDPAPLSAAVSKKQSPFLGSQRQVRGAVLRALADGPKSEQALLREVTSDLHDVMVVIAMLETEGFVECHGTTWSLAGDHDN